MIISDEVRQWCTAQVESYFYNDLWILFLSLIFIALGIITREIKLKMGDEEWEKTSNLSTIGLLYGALALIIGFIYLNL